jgi:hypothetical protein
MHGNYNKITVYDLYNEPFGTWNLLPTSPSPLYVFRPTSKKRPLGLDFEKLFRKCFAPCR